MNKNFNEKIEKDLDNYISLVYKYNYEVTHAEEISNKLLECFETTKYPGIYYRIAYLYEAGAFKTLKEDKSIEYYKRAARLNYVPAMNRLAEIGLKNTNKHLFKYANFAEKSAIQFEDNYGTYLLARYLILDGILEHSSKECFKQGIEMMRKSAELGCTEAKQYLEMMEK